MDLSIYNVIVGPVLSEKAYKLNKQFKKLVLTVHAHANKNMVAQALEKLFNVKVAKVNIFIRKGKNKRAKGRFTITGPKKKRAVVTLAEGYSLDVFDQAGTTVTATEQIAQSSSVAGGKQTENAG